MPFSPSVMSPIGNLRDLSTNDDTSPGKSAAPVPLSSALACDTTDPTRRMSTNDDIP